LASNAGVFNQKTCFEEVIAQLFFEKKYLKKLLMPNENECEK
jgi:hypothetical protein